MELSEYVKRAMQEPSREHIEAMWKRVFMLKAWYFVPASETEGPTRPMVTTIEGEAWIPAFTNVRRYREFAASVGRLHDDKAHALILDPGESMQKIVEVREAITGVVFNPGSEETFRAPVEALVAYAEHFEIPKFGPSEQ